MAEALELAVEQQAAVAAGLVESELDALGADVEDGDAARGHGQVSR